MAGNKSLALLCLAAVCTVSIAAYVEAVAGVFDISRGHIVPQVSLRCGFLNKHIDMETGMWVDGELSSPCDVSKNAILDYCRQVYSDLNVNNIEDSNEDVEISHWCPMDAPDIPEGCTETFTVTSYTCLVGDFESKALMVPKDCNFEHIHDSESCKPKSELHSMADKQCAANNMAVRDYGMLLPCADEVDLFTGVEFVCCPQPQEARKPTKVSRPEVPEEAETAPEQLPNVEPVKPAAPQTDQAPVTDEEEEPVSEDAYFKQVPLDEEERDAFEEAKARLEEKEDRKKTQVMQQWQEAQEQYETLKKKDPKGAEAMKKGMMARFDDTMAELELAARKEHEKLRVVHQHRVQVTLTESRTHAEEMFAESLREEPPKTKKVLHTLQKYVKTIQRDKQHGINVYKHLLATDPAHAESQRQETLARLQDMDGSIQHCLDMLKKAPEVYSAIQNKVEDLLAASQSPEDIAFLRSMETALTLATDAAEEEVAEEVEVVENKAPEEPPTPKKTPKKAVSKSKPAKAAKPSKPLPRAPVVAKILPPFGKAPAGRKVPQVPDLPMVVAQIEPEEPEELEEPEDGEIAEKGEAQPMVKIIKAEAPEEQPEALENEDVSLPKHLPIIAVKPLDRYLDNEAEETETDQEPSEPVEPAEPEQPSKAAKPILVAKKQPQKTQKAAASKMDKGAEFRPKAGSSIDNSVSQRSIKYGATPALAFGLACGVLAVATVMVVAVVLVRRKTRRVPVNHGFTEIDPNMTVEQRHIAAMQANGYENPTYKYFEMQ